MTTLTRLGTALVAACLAVLVSATGANAAASGHIVSADSGDGKVTVVFGGSGLGDQGLDASTVTLTLNGQKVPATATSVGSGVKAPQRTAVIVIDTSGSMAGAGLSAAKGAAGAFLDAVPADVAVGLVTFSDTASVAVAPTKDRNAVRSAVGGLQAHGETALYDATALALKTAGSAGVRNVLILSDGGDTRSKTTLAQAAAQTSAAKVTLDAVGFRTSESQNSALQQLAAAGHGKVFAGAQAAAIAQAFTQTAKDIAHQLVVTADVPKALADHSVTIAVSAIAGAATLTDSAFVHLAAAPKAAPKPADFGPAPAPLDRAATWSKSYLYAALAALFIGLVAVVAVAMSSARKLGGQSSIRRRLSVYTLTGKAVEERKEEAGVLGDSAVARSAMELAGRVVSNRDFEQRLQQKLDAGAIPLKPAEWLLVHAGIALGTALILLLISGGKLLWAALGLVVGALGPLAYLQIKETRRKAAFMAQLPDTLQLMAGSLSAGYSLPQAVDAVVREGAEPIVSEFNRALVDARLGVPIEDALEQYRHERMDSQDFAWVVMAIRIQREVGGNLSEILTIVANTLRERERLRRQVQVLSAEGRLSAVILGWPPTAVRPLHARRSAGVHPACSDTEFAGHRHAGRRRRPACSSAASGCARSSGWRSDMGNAALICGSRRDLRRHCACRHQRRLPAATERSRSTGRWPPSVRSRSAADVDAARGWRRRSTSGCSLPRTRAAGPARPPLQPRGVRGQASETGWNWRAIPPNWDVDRVLAFKMLGVHRWAAGGGVLLPVALGGNMLTTVRPADHCSAAGFFAPDILLIDKGQRRQEQIQTDLPDALDLLSISVEAGLAFDAALAQVARNTNGPLADEFFRVLQEMQIGKGRADAIRALRSADHRGRAQGLRHCDGAGRRFRHPNRQRLRVQAKEQRVKR